MLKEWGAERNGKLPYLFISSKTATMVPDFAVEDRLWAELQHWCMGLQCKTDDNDYVAYAKPKEHKNV